MSVCRYWGQWIKGVRRCMSVLGVRGEICNGVGVY